MATTVAPHAVVIGAGIIGLAHAITAREAGWRVTLLERDPRARGASVRNFGTIWPIGCVPGAEREQGLFGAQRWKALAAAADFWIAPHGSLTLAYREEAWAVLQEFAALNGAAVDHTICSADDVTRRFPAVQPNGLLGALRSDAECVVHPPSALLALARYAQQIGVTMHFGTPVVQVHDDALTTSDGRLIAFDRLVIAAGEEMRLLFPSEVADAQVQPCRLQMMRTAPQPAGFDLGAILVSDLTLCHYPAFQQCPSIPALRARLDRELPQHRAEGVHVIVAQHHDGSITLGDSHEYGEDLAPESRTDVDELILTALRVFVQLPEPRIVSRWQGVYLKSRIGQTQVVLRPRERVTMVTAMGGLGMTLSWGLAQRTVQDWST
jgi:FAD dependent oxidoreductase TIGR03364